MAVLDRIPSFTKPVTKICEVTPDLAREYLSHNLGNRHVRRSQVEYFRREVQEGRLRLTHQGVAFDTSGRLIDGQHRLLAIVEAGVPAQMMVTTGLDPDAYNSIDFAGAQRSMADVLGMDKAHVQPINFLLMFTEGIKKIDPAELAPYLSTFGVAAEMLHRHCPTARRGFSQAPVRAAACLVAVEMDDWDYPFDIYRALVLQDYASLPPVALAFITQVQYGVRGERSQKLSRDAIFLRAVKSMTPKYASSRHLQIRDLKEWSEQVRARVRDLVQDAKSP